MSRFFDLSLRSAALAAAVLLSACGGQETSADLKDSAPAADLVTTTHYNLVNADGNTAAPFGTCSTSSGAVVVNSATLAITGTTAVADFFGTKNGAPAAYEAKGTVTVNGANYTFKISGTTFVGTLSNGVITATGTACGASHTLSYQQQ
jgi:hypothetical protein